VPVTLAHILTLNNVYHNKHSEDTVHSGTVQRNLYILAYNCKYMWGKEVKKRVRGRGEEREREGERL